MFKVRKLYKCFHIYLYLQQIKIKNKIDNKNIFQHNNIYKILIKKVV